MSRLALTAAGAAAGVLAVYVLFVRTTFGQEIDEAALEGRARAHGIPARAAEALLATITAGTLALAVVGLVLVALASGRWTRAVAAAAAVAGAIVTSELLKRVVFDRPDLLDLADGPSYPSGHSTIGFAVGLGLVVATGARGPRTYVVAVLSGAAVGIATIACGWHRPSDVLGGFLVATAWAAAALAVLAAVGHGGGHTRRLAARWAWTAAGLTAVAVAVVVVLTGRDELGRVDWVDPDADFLGACVFVVAAAAACAAALADAVSRRAGPPAR